MPDTTTHKIMQKVEKLPPNKKLALLELLSSIPVEYKQKNQKNNEKLSALRKQELLSISAWTDSEIDEIYKAREYINQWNPKTL